MFWGSQIALALDSCNFEKYQNIDHAHKSRNALAFIRFSLLILGVDGIEKKLPCPPVKDQNAIKLPSKLSEAINALKEDQVICDALGQQFVEWFVEMKNKQEIKAMKDLQGEKLFEKERETYIHL